MKLAYFSPLNPQPSGISDYSEELLPYLAAQAHIDLFVDGFRPSNQELLLDFRWFDYRQDPTALERLQEYDAVLYHMGNDHRYHAGIFDVMRDHPGVVVFHDFALQDFFLGLARVRGNVELYLAEIAACHGNNERIRAEEHLLRGSVPPQVAAPLDFPLNCRAARAAEGIIVHSQWSRARFESLAPAVPLMQIPMPVANIRADKAAKTGSKADNREPPAVSIASFGLVTPDKGIEITLRALAQLRDQYDFHFTLVGAENSYFDVQAIMNNCGMSDRVTITGRVTLAEFERYISETDIAINLRQRTVGETSASLYRIMAASVPAIVSNVGAFAELPNDAVVKIDHDHCTDALLQAYLRKLMEDKQFRLRIGANARRHVLGEHDVQQSADRYVDFIRKLIANRSRKQLINDVADEVSVLGLRANDDSFLRGVASEVALLAPVQSLAATPTTLLQTGRNADVRSDASTKGNGHPGKIPSRNTEGRLPKIEGLDYKRAAFQYSSMLDAERRYYLRTKPFYNLANKPDKHLGDGMDAETHRHFCDFANMAVALALPAGARILDVGCGSGWLSEYFARLGYDVTGIDISHDLLQMARERLKLIPHQVDHETPLQCRFREHDIESEPLPENFDAIICYDSLHHFEDERAVMRHLSSMVNRGGLLFILEGDKPEPGSATEEELVDVMRRYQTLESPFDPEYLRELVVEHGFKVVGDYVSANGFFERETIEDGSVEVEITEINYLLCKKVVDGVGTARDLADSREPGILTARLTPSGSVPGEVAVGSQVSIHLRIENTGDTIWLIGPARRKGAVMIAVMLLDESGHPLSERHGEPPLPRVLGPGEKAQVVIRFRAPDRPGSYTLKVDLVAQHVCWFEEKGSQPYLLTLVVR